MGRRWSNSCGLLRIWNVSLWQLKAGMVRVMAKVSPCPVPSIPGRTAAHVTPGACLHSWLWPSLYDELRTSHVNQCLLCGHVHLWVFIPNFTIRGHWDSGLQIKPIATVGTRFSLSASKVEVIVLVVLINSSLPSWTAGTRRARASSVSELHRVLST